MFNTLKNVESSFPQRSITYNEIAGKLLEDHLFLTALELHTELIECGKELKPLKDFFSNPGNFETNILESSSRISRSGSQVTLDSLDLTRYSEDGAVGDEKIAVLEFELRKAKETINALRNNLTVATESESSSPDKGSLRQTNIGYIKPHEQRALHFLINEYLLHHEYKLTSITFADENQNQDFDDWDDVGLNISKPHELFILYREGLKHTAGNCKSDYTQTSNENTYETEDNNIKKLSLEIVKLKEQLISFDEQCAELKHINAELMKENELLSIRLTESTANETHDKHKESIGSESPDRFEIVEKNFANISKKIDSLNNTDDSVSNNSFNPNEWTTLSMNIHDQIENNAKYDDKLSDLSSNDLKNRIFDFDIIRKETFKKEVFSLCYVNIPSKVDNDILDDILNSSTINKSLVHTLSHSLLKIIPNIILNKREEVIPLLISAVHLNPDGSERDKLLQQLFNLKKKPSDSERTIILSGLVGIAKCSGQSMVENEILPQCWEQLGHKYIERRLLVVEACTALIPYVSSPIRNSLILSILQQMIDDKEEDVRETVIRSLALLITICDDDNKYNQCEELVFNTLNDSSSKLVNVSTHLLFPVLAKWAFEIGCLTSSLFKKLLHKLNSILKEPESNRKAYSTDKVIRIIYVVESLMPFLLMSVACNPVILENVEKDMVVDLRPELKKLCTELTNPLTFYNSSLNVGVILYEFEKYVADNRNISWTELDWILDMLIPDLLNNLYHVEINQVTLVESFFTLFSNMCVIFGKSFTNTKIRPLVQIRTQNLEQVLSDYAQFSLSLNILPVYLVSILAYCDNSDEILNVLKKLLTALPVCGAPLDCLEISVKRLCELGYQDVVLASLWEGVVHQRPLVRAATASLFASIITYCNENLLSLKITPAIVTLASDNEMLVRTATIPALGNLIKDCKVNEIHDKVYMQFQSYISDNAFKENHTLLRQLIVTFGNIAIHCQSSFRQDVILPQLCGLACYMLHMTSQTRKVDMALALVEAFTNIVYTSINNQVIGLQVLNGLRCLETVVSENQSLMCHRETVISMIKECESKSHVTTPQSPTDIAVKFNVNQGMEEMKMRVSKIFNKPSTGSSSNSTSGIGLKPNPLPNLQGLFKKK